MAFRTRISANESAKTCNTSRRSAGVNDSIHFRHFRFEFAAPRSLVVSVQQMAVRYATRRLMEESLRAAREGRDQFYPECEAVFAYEGRWLAIP